MCLDLLKPFYFKLEMSGGNSACSPQGLCDVCESQIPPFHIDSHCPGLEAAPNTLPAVAALAHLFPSDFSIKETFVVPGEVTASSEPLKSLRCLLDFS